MADLGEGLNSPQRECVLQYFNWTVGIDPVRKNELLQAKQDKVGDPFVFTQRLDQNLEKEKKRKKATVGYSRQ